jgi:hypothetical protein
VPTGVEEEVENVRGSGSCSVTCANVMGLARLNPCSKNTEGILSSGGIVLAYGGTREALREEDEGVGKDGSVLEVGVGCESDAIDARGVMLSSLSRFCKAEESS